MAVTEPIQDSAEQAGAVEDQHFSISVGSNGTNASGNTPGSGGTGSGDGGRWCNKCQYWQPTDWYLVVVEVAEAEPEPAVMVATVE